MSQSARDFQRLVLPILRIIWHGCDFIHTENNPDEVSKVLDCYSGIDVIRIDHTNKTVTGIASRIQRSDKNWGTFTVRCQRDNGTPTEYAKRICALQHDNIIPALTYQAYVNPAGDKLVALAIARTTDIWRLIADGNVLSRHTNSEQIGQATFYVVPWQDMLQKNFEVVRITPTSDGFCAQWSAGKKFFKVTL